MEAETNVHDDFSQVGICLKHLPAASIGQHFHGDNVPWQRVINSKGIISVRCVIPTFINIAAMPKYSNRGPGGAARQATALRREGVTVRTGHLGELTIDFGTFGWFPTSLPSEGADDSESEDQTEA